jgi:hypothetical protein
LPTGLPAHAASRTAIVAGILGELPSGLCASARRLASADAVRRARGSRKWVYIIGWSGDGPVKIGVSAVITGKASADVVPLKGVRRVAPLKKARRG